MLPFLLVVPSVCAHRLTHSLRVAAAARRLSALAVTVLACLVALELV
ncbi:hypothetical protein [Streptomyces sp. CoH27]|nr:hypothetical protein [Streptomyces sp. CoH27]